MRGVAHRVFRRSARRERVSDMGKGKDFWIIRFGERSDHLRELAEQTAQLVNELAPDDAEKQSEVIRMINRLLNQADELYRTVWQTIGKPDSDDSELLINVKNRLIYILLDEYSKWPESGSGISYEQRDP